MGCGASSLKSTDEHRDDLAPKVYNQNEVRKTSGFTRSNSAGAVPTADDYGNNTSYSNTGRESEATRLLGKDDTGEAKQKTKKELLAQAKARQAGRLSDTMHLQIAGMGFS